jgi:hypothetical protein
MHSWSFNHVDTVGIWFMLGTGILVMLTSLLGLRGACNANTRTGGWKCSLRLYSLLLFLIVVAQLVAGSLVLMWAGDLDELKTDLTNHKVNIDSTEQELNNVLDHIYKDCCSYQNNNSFTPSIEVDGTDISLSACNLINKDPACGTSAGETEFKQGIIDFVNKNIRPVGIVSLCLGGGELLVLLASCCLLCTKMRNQNPLDADFNYDYMDRNVGV